MTDTIATPAHIVHKIIVLATGIPGSESIRDEVMAMYEANGSWNEVADVLDAYMNSLLAQNSDGIPGMIRQLANNGFGAAISLQDAEALTQEFAAAGIETWSGLFEWLHVNVDGDLAATWSNRADSAASFTSLLGSLNKNDDYDGAQVINAAREWMSGIGASDESVQAAKDAASKLVARFEDGKVKGTAIDGYVAGATVYIDVNNNGQHDEGEPITTTDERGDFTFDEDNLPAGKLVGSGGIDLATGQPFTGEMTAPSGAAVLSPLTTLVQQMMEATPGRSQSDVEDIVFRALNLPRVDLSSYDPIEAGLDTTTTREAQVNAAKIQAATSQLVNVMNVSQAVTGKVSQQAGESANRSFISALAETLEEAASTGSVVNLSDTTTVSNVVRKTAEKSGAVNEQSSDADRQRLDDLSNKAASAVRDVNVKTQQAVDDLASNSSTNVVDALSDVFKLQTLTQTNVAPSIRDTDDDQLDQVIDRFSGNNLDNEVEDVQAGRLNDTTDSSQGNVTRPSAPDPTTPVPGIRLTEDTGRSDTDRITKNGELTLSNMVQPDNWEYSLDNGSTWIEGSGTTFAPRVQGEVTVRVRQTDPSIGDVAQNSFTYTVDTEIPTIPRFALDTDSGLNGSDRITTDGTVNISGLESDASWQYREAGSSEWTDGSGSAFELTGDGSKTVYVRQTDVAGNHSNEGSLAFTLDTSAPDAPSASFTNTGSISDTLTNTGLINVSGIEPFALAEFSTDGGSTWQSMAQFTSGCTWSGQFELTGDGEKSVLVRQTDQAGNVSEPTSLSFELDATAPSAPVLSLVNDTNISDDNITSEPAIQIDGLTEEGQLVEFRLNGSSIWQSAVKGIPIEHEGTYNVEVRQHDAAGNISDAGSLTFTYDKTAPAAPDFGLANDTGTPSDQLTYDRTVNISNLESGATWQFRQYLVGVSSEWQDGSGSSFELDGPDGERIVYVRQIDIAGNASTQVSQVITLDTTAPGALNLTLINDSGDNTSDRLTNDGAFEISGLEDGASWEFSLDGGSTWADGSGSSFNVADAEGGDGQYSVVVRQTDVAGNVSAGSSVQINLDTTAPAALSVQPAESVNYQSQLITNDRTMSVNLDNLEQGARWEYQITANNVRVAGPEWQAGSGSSFELDGSDGHYSVAVRQIDAAGNISALASQSLVLDTTAPDVVSLRLAQDSGISASDLLSNDDTIVVEGLESAATWQYQAVFGSNASIDESAWLSGSGSGFDAAGAEGGDGQYTVFVRQSDVAGNPSETASFTFTLDTQNPAAPQVSLFENTGSASDMITNNGRVRVDGLEPDARAFYSLDNGQSWQGMSLYSSDGEWLGEFQLQGDGSKDVLVRQIDAADNVSSHTSFSFQLDTQAPTAPSITFENTSYLGSDLLTRTASVRVDDLEPTASWQYSLDGGSSWNAGNGSGFTLPQDADYAIVVRQTDVADNTSKDSGVFNVRLDTTAPDALSLGLINDSGDNTSDSLTNDGRIELSGLEPDASWQVQAVPGSNASIDESGWQTASGSSFNVADAEGGDGDYTIYVRQTDVAGNVSEASSFNFRLDTSASTPSLTLESSNTIGSQVITNNGQVNVSGLESGADWEYSIDGGSTWNDGSGSSFTTSTDSTSYVDLGVRVRQTDAAGNVSGQASLDFRLDQQKPSVPFAYLSNNTNTQSGTITSDGSIRVSGLEANATAQYSLDGGQTWDGMSQFSCGCAWEGYFKVEGDDEEKNVLIRQLDLAGNSSDATSLNFTLDTTAPEGHSLSVLDTGSSNSDLITSSGEITVAGLEEGARWQYQAMLGSNATIHESAWQVGSGSGFDVAAAEGGDGDYTVYVRQIDQAANISEPVSLVFTLDTAAATPAASLAVNSGSTSDSLTNNATIAVADLESGAAWEYSVGSSSNWQPGEGSSFVGAKADGEHTVYVRQTDLAGNVSGAGSLTFTLDTEAPTSAPNYYLVNNSSSGSDFITNDGRIRVYNVESDGSAEYSLDDGQTWADVSQFGCCGCCGWLGEFELQGDGDKTVLIRQVDAADNASPTTSLSLTLDTVALAPSLTLSGDELTVDISGLESGASWQYYLDGNKTWITGGSGATFNVADAGSASTLYVRQVDVAGNVSDEQTLELPTGGQTILINNYSGNYSGGSGDDLFDASQLWLMMDIPFTVDGGAGNDTLKLRFEMEAMFDYSAGRVSNIERIDLTEGYAYYVRLSPQTVAGFTDARNALELVFRGPSERDMAQQYILSDSGWDANNINVVGVANVITGSGGVTLTLSYDGI